MRVVGAAFRTPVTIHPEGENLGDGVTYGAPRDTLGTVRRSLRITRGPQGDTVSSPMVVELPHDDPVSTGDKISAGGDVARVTGVQPIAGAFGVPHHLEVTAT